MDFIAWLCGGPSETKTRSNDRVHHESLKVNKRILGRWLTSDEDFASADMLAQHVLGAVACKASFVYDASCVLTQVQNAQRLHWRDRGVPEGDLWYFKVLDCVFFAEPFAAAHFINHSKSKVYDIISEDSAAELALSVNPRPDWFDEGPRLCFKVPPRIAYLMLKQGWRDMCLPSPFTRGPWHMAAWKLDMMEHAFARAFHGLQAAGARVLPPDGHRNFSLTDCRNLADDLRTYLGQVSEGSVPEVLSWIRQLQNTSDDLEVPQVATSQKFHRLIDFILLCELLKDVGSAREVINRALELTLPKSLLEIAQLHLKQQRFFDKGEISRFRIVLDVAYMLLHRVTSWVKFMKGEKTSRYLMWDSSPQFSRDYEMIRIVSIPETRLWDVFSAVTRMSSMWLDTEAGDMAAVKLDPAKTLDEAAQAEEASLMRKCEDILRPHICPAVILGFGATSLSHKFHTLCHAMRLEQFTGASLEFCSRQFVSVTSDFGVEHMLGRVARVNVSEVCQYFEDADDQSLQSLLSSVLSKEDVSTEAVLEEPDVRHAVPVGESVESDELEGPVIQPVLLADAAVVPGDLLEPPPADPLSDLEADVLGHDPAAVFEEVPPSPCVDFTGMLSFPGLHHVLDNAINGMPGAMPNYKEFIHLASRLCKFLHGKETRDILLERCFGDPVGMQFREDFKDFKGHIFPGRWGTVAFSVPLLRALERPLRWGWNKAVYLRDANAREASLTVIVNDVDQAISNPFFWAWLSVLDALVVVVRKMTAWLEGCPCHWPLLQQVSDVVPKDLISRWKRCPMRGLRAPEACSGEFLFIAGVICDNTIADLLQNLPNDITREERAELVDEFDAGRSHLCFYLSLKATALEEFPWKVCALAHTDEETAKDALRECLAFQGPLDSRLTRLQGPLRPACDRWLAGDSLSGPGMLDLALLISELRFIPVNERPAEGLHRQTKLYGRNRPNHSVPFMSLKQRMPELKQLLHVKPVALHDLAALCDVVHNNWLCVSTLGLKSHPALANVRQKRNSFRNTIMAQVVYHADAMTLYTLAVPDVPMMPDDPGDPGGPRLGNAGNQDRDDGEDDGGGCGPMNEPGSEDDDDEAASDPESAASQGAMDVHDGVGRIAAFDPKTASLKALVSSHAGESEALLQKLMLQRLSEVLPEHGGQFLSMPFLEKAMRNLAAVLKLDNKLTFEPGDDINLEPKLRPKRLHDSELVLDATLTHRRDFTADVRSLLFFKVVRNNPMQLKRSKVPGETGFASGDIVVAPHKLYDVETGKKQVTVQALALQKPASEARSMSTSSFVLNFRSLECQQLAELRTWEKRTGLKYVIKPHASLDSSGWSKQQHEALGILLEELMENASGVRGTFWRLASERKEILKVFADLDWVVRTAVPCRGFYF